MGEQVKKQIHQASPTQVSTCFHKSSQSSPSSPWFLKAHPAEAPICPGACELRSPDHESSEGRRLHQKKRVFHKEFKHQKWSLNQQVSNPSIYLIIFIKQKWKLIPSSVIYLQHLMVHTFWYPTWVGSRSSRKRDSSSPKGKSRVDIEGRAEEINKVSLLGLIIKICIYIYICIIYIWYIYIYIHTNTYNYIYICVIRIFGGRWGGGGREGREGREGRGVPGWALRRLWYFEVHDGSSFYINIIRIV